jgi:hypothetical protein
MTCLADGDDDGDDDDAFAAEQKHVRRINGDFWGRVGNGWFPLEDVKMFVSLCVATITVSDS